MIPPTASATCTRTSFATCPHYFYTYQGASANLSALDLSSGVSQSKITQKQQVWVEDQTSTTRTDTWMYSITPGASTTITNPDGGQEVVNWTVHSNSQCLASFGPPLVDKIVHPDKSTEEHTWQQNVPFKSGVCDPGNFYLATNYTSVSDGATAKAVSGKTFAYL